MPNRNYESGRRFEYEVMKEWQRRGYETIRASGSHGLFDIVCLPKRLGYPVTAIQCKVVDTIGKAQAMMERFRANPPMTPSDFHQTLAIKVKHVGTVGVTV